MTNVTSPQRYKLSRARGARKPPATVVVTRASRWGNPYPMSEYGREIAIALYVRDLASGGVRWKRWTITVPYIRQELAGKDVCCFCDLTQACHGDVILRVAAGGEPDGP